MTELPSVENDIPVFILCGGQGTRLRELTELKPKPMVEIGGRPILWHIMKLYRHHGFRRFILCLGYRGVAIREYFLNYRANNQPFTVDLSTGELRYHDVLSEDWEVTLVETGEKTMTGGRIARAARFLRPIDRTFAVTYGDGVSDVDLAGALAQHLAAGRLASVTAIHPTSRFGLLVHEGDRVVSFSEKPTQKDVLASGGFFFFERDFLQYLDTGEGCVLEQAPLTRCAEEGQLSFYRHDGYWECMDTHRDWLRLSAEWNSGQAPWAVWL